VALWSFWEAHDRGVRPFSQPVCRCSERHAGLGCVSHKVTPLCLGDLASWSPMIEYDGQDPSETKDLIRCPWRVECLVEPQQVARVVERLRSATRWNFPLR